VTNQRLAVRTAVILGVIIAGFGVVYGPPDRAFEGLDGEWTPASFFSGAVLFAAAWLVYRYARRQTRAALVAGLALAALLAVMGVDEIVTLHERIENRTGIDWQLLYSPLVVAAGIGALILLRTMPRAAAACFLLGGACWFGAQVLELVQWRDDVLIHPFLVLPEELGEMAGSSLIVISMLLAQPREELEVAPAGKGAAEGDLVGVLEVTPDRKP